MKIKELQEGCLQQLGASPISRESILSLISKGRRVLGRRLLSGTFLIAMMLCPFAVRAQVPVALSPLAKQQFLSITGVPLASGCVNTFITGTSTPLATYTDGTGTTTNPNPIILDAGGFANIWLKNASYRFTLTSAGGVNCASGVFQYTVDAVSAYTVINQAQNIFLLGASSDPGGSAGELAYRTDIPCFRGFSTLWDCFVTLTATQTLTNKTIANGAFTGAETGMVITAPQVNNPTINGVLVPGPPATYLQMTNDLVTGTTLNKLTKINPAGLAGLAILPLISDTGGIIGITVAGAGISGLASIQQSGSASCVFDNAVTAGHYVQISASVAGDCTDSGIAYPTSGQVIGRLLATNGAPGTYLVDLFGPEIKALSAAVGSVTLNKQDTQVAATTGNGAAQTVFTYTMPGATLAAGKCLNITFYLQKVSGANALTPSLTFGATTLISVQSLVANGSWQLTAKVCNNQGTTTAQWAGALETSTNITSVVTTAPAENAAGNITITGTANVAAPDTWKGMGWTVVTDP